MDENQETVEGIHMWQTLVHVCRQWRNIVFASPRCLNLQLGLTPRRLAKDTLDSDVRPALPLVIQGCVSTSNVDNIISGLERSNSHGVSKIDLSFQSSQLGDVSAAMQVPSPELTDLLSYSGRTKRRPSHDSPPQFLPRWIYLTSAIPSAAWHSISGITEAALVCSAATHLVHLHLYHIPHPGYISPEAMVADLSVLNSLEDLRLDFEPPQSCPNRESCRSPAPTRSVLPIPSRFAVSGSKGPVNTWRTSWPASMPLDSATLK